MFTFSVIFEGGFALTPICREVKFIAEKTSEVMIQAFPSREEAYKFACERFVEHELKKNPYEQPVLPRLEELKQKIIFRKPDIVNHSVTFRIFAAIHPEYLGIMTNTESMAGFLENFPFNSMVREVGSVLEAQNFLNYEYLRRILPISAYIQESIPYCNNIPVNTIIPTPYVAWMKKHCNLPGYFSSDGFFSPTAGLVQIVDRVKVEERQEIIHG